MPPKKRPIHRKEHPESQRETAGGHRPDHPLLGKGRKCIRRPKGLTPQLLHRGSPCSAGCPSSEAVAPPSQRKRLLPDKVCLLSDQAYLLTGQASPPPQGVSSAGNRRQLGGRGGPLADRPARLLARKGLHRGRPVDPRAQARSERYLLWTAEDARQAGQIPQMLARGKMIPRGCSICLWIKSIHYCALSLSRSGSLSVNLNDFLHWIPSHL